MALINVNPVEYRPAKKGTLDQIAQGVEIAKNVLGAAALGSEMYSNIWGEKGKLLAAERAKTEAETPYIQAQTKKIEAEAEQGNLSLTPLDQEFLKTLAQNNDEVPVHPSTPGAKSRILPSGKVVTVGSLGVSPEKVKAAGDIKEKFGNEPVVQAYERGSEAVNAMYASLKNPNRTPFDDTEMLVNFQKILVPSLRNAVGQAPEIEGYTSSLIDNIQKKYHELTTGQKRILDPQEVKAIAATATRAIQALRPYYQGKVDQAGEQAGLMRAPSLIRPYPEINIADDIKHLVPPKEDQKKSTLKKLKLQ